LIIALLIKIDSKGPVIFKQVRIGLNGKKFVCYKFRTMRTDAPKNLSTEEFKNSEDFITPIGSFLRRTSLDEIPQLFNVLAGDMSIVGPRPLIPHEKEIHAIRKRFDVYSVRPGITGLAQICGRDRLSDIKKVECDAIYVENISFACDIQIVITTLWRVFSKDGVKDGKKAYLDNVKKG
jgi:O-antigen biosynthesis protein WbqP